ncbi:TPA: DNA-methyltransferase [Photobacterium damselae]
MIKLEHGDCLELLKLLPDNFVDSIVTDPPYGLEFMNKKWDKGIPSVDVWAECLRVLKPGGYLLAFAGTRTQHRMACNIEDAGFDIKDMIAWLYGSGFPKSMNISKQIDKTLGCTPIDTGKSKRTNSRKARQNGELVGSVSVEELKYVPITAPSSDKAKEWDGWGTALKPAIEPITVARKPHKGTIANNVLKHGVGGLNIDACRVGYENDAQNPATNPLYRQKAGYKCDSSPDKGSNSFSIKSNGGTKNAHQEGRFPANLVHDGSDEVLELFPKNAGARAKVKGSEPSNLTNNCYNQMNRGEGVFYGDKGSAARFFYCAKASPSERNLGMPDGQKNVHVTVKPISLARWLIKLVTPVGGTTIDPFMGSGSMGVAAIHENMNFIGFEIEKESFDTARYRINHAKSLK